MAQTLLEAVLANDVLSANSLIKAGASVNEIVKVKNQFVINRLEKVDAEYDGTLLYVGCGLGHENVVGLLLEKGATQSLDVKGTCAEVGQKQEVTYKRGVIEGTPLFIATVRGHWHVMEMLLEKGADYSIPGSVPVMKGYVVSGTNKGTPLEVAGEKVSGALKRWIVGHMTPQQWLGVFASYDSKHHGNLSTFEAKKLLTDYDVQVPDTELAEYKSGKKFDFQEFCKLWVKHGCVHQAIVDSAENPPTPAPPGDLQRKGSIGRTTTAPAKQGSSTGLTRQGSTGATTAAPAVAGLRRQSSDKGMKAAAAPKVAHGSPVHHAAPVAPKPASPKSPTRPTPSHGAAHAGTKK